MEAKKALSSIAAQCSKKEYCSFDVVTQLQRWELSDKEIAEILAFLVKHRFLNDERFALAYARDKFRFNRWGKAKIEQMLRQKHISDPVIYAAITALPDDDYDEMCISLLKQKARSLKEEDPYKRKAKLFRFALGRGFSAEIISRCLEKL